MLVVILWMRVVRLLRRCVMVDFCLGCVGLVRDNWMGYRVTEDMVWFLKFDYIENAECAIGDVPEVLREYVESGILDGC